ncbi:type I phosphodiesterase [Dichotomopilus funicola]|uniref:Type I phosphodiesterase n=1 Tax=Dichotomopilus funicola TaxID=1934379 RepID=A0AAN6ZIX8_9PEZI|nr:type I phosphodiesterase [Dichotomopilus funicola]
MHLKLQSCAVSWVLLAGLARADADDAKYKHVAFFSIDGLHASDVPKWVSAEPHGAIASLLKTGYWYAGALTSAPSDSFPGIVNLVSGAKPAQSGIWYDDGYGKLHFACPWHQRAVVYDETKDYDNTKLWSSPNPTVVGGNIDPANLPQAMVRGECINLYPHQRLRVNTIFEVVHPHGQTAYTDKHPAYDMVRGPSGKGLSVGYFPEIQSVDTTNVTQIIGYDTLHVQAFLDWIDGKTPANTEVQEALTGIPKLFGGNFQAVSVAQKSYGYEPHTVAFTPQLTTALTFVDDSLGKVVAALQAKSVLHDTLIIVCGKHGQTPVDPTLFRRVDQHLIAPAAGVTVSQVTADDVALLWLADQRDLAKAVAGLEKARATLAIQDIIYGDRLRDLGFGDPAKDPAVPDIIIVPDLGVVYTTSHAKIAEHGGLSADSRNVSCFVSNPSLQKREFDGPVSTAQVAPTILKALGLDPNELDSVKHGGDDLDVLPGF